MPRIRAESIAEHKEVTRRRILDAARSNFLEFGYNGTALADIALDADIGRTTLYEYFPDKESVLIELVNEELPALIDDILARLPEGLECGDHLGRLVELHLEFIADDSHLGTMLMRDSNQMSADAQRKIRDAHRQLEHALVDVYRKGVESGEFRPIEPAVAAEMVNAVTMYGARTLLRSKNPKAEVAATSKIVVEFLLHGLGSH